MSCILTTCVSVSQFFVVLCNCSKKYAYKEELTKLGILETFSTDKGGERDKKYLSKSSVWKSTLARNSDLVLSGNTCRKGNLSLFLDDLSLEGVLVYLLCTNKSPFFIFSRALS